MKLDSLTIKDDINYDEYIDYYTYIKSTMDHPEWLGDFSKEDIIFLTNNGSKVWMVYDGDKIVCSMMYIPGSEKDLKRYEIDYDYKKVCDYGPMMVSPKYLGNGLQYQMLYYLGNYAKEKGCTMAISTVDPENIYSIKNFIKNGFKLHLTKEFKRGIRNVYIKEL